MIKLIKEFINYLSYVEKIIITVPVLISSFFIFTNPLIFQVVCVINYIIMNLYFCWWLVFYINKQDSQPKIISHYELYPMSYIDALEYIKEVECRKVCKFFWDNEYLCTTTIDNILFVEHHLQNGSVELYKYDDLYHRACLFDGWYHIKDWKVFKE